MPVVIIALGTILKGLVKGVEDLEIRWQVDTILTTALSRSARIQRRILKSLAFTQTSVEDQSPNTSVKNS